MALQFSTALRNARADRIESYVGASAILKLRSGSVPASCASADSGTVLATLNLPADWMNDAAAGAVTLKGTWQDTSCDATGTAGHFRIYRSDGTTCELQGTVTSSGGGGDITLSSTSLVSGGSVTITSFTITEGNS
jgi:hypothetical protein